MISAFGKLTLVVALMVGCLGGPLQANALIAPNGHGGAKVEEPHPIPDPVPDPTPIPGEIIEWFASMGFGDFSWGAIATEMVTAPSIGFPKAGIKIAYSKCHR